jgi:hypothetical protein
VLGELGAPSYDSGHECGVEWLIGHAACVLPSVLRYVDVQPSTKLCRIEEGKARVHDLKVHFDEIKGESTREMMAVSTRPRRIQLRLLYTEGLVFQLVGKVPPVLVEIRRLGIGATVGKWT